MKTFAFFTALLLVLAPLPAGAQVAEEDAVDVLPKVVLPKVEAQEIEAIIGLVGERAVVTGDVSNTHEWEGGITFINFRESEFVLVCMEADYERFGEPRLAERLRDSRVTVVGIIALHKGKPQIRLESPAQILRVAPLAPVGD